jgi:acyl-CoA thioester hydrolase
MSSSDTTAPEIDKPRKRGKAADENSTAVLPVQARHEPLFVASIGVRWRDLDAFNHVNNSNFLTYLEEARLQWLRHVPGPWFDEHAMPVLAASEVNYRQPIEWPAQLNVELSCERLGHTSITIAHRIVDAEQTDRLYSDGKVVMVWMNPSTGTPVPLPQAIRDSAESAGA